MPNGDVAICHSVREALKNNGILESEKDIQNATKFNIKAGANKAGLIVYNTGKIHVEGAESDLKKWAGELKVS